MKKLIVAAVVAVLALAVLAPTMALGGKAMAVIPQLPQAFWGQVWLDGGPAPVSTQITGKAQNVRLPAYNNPFVITEAGKLGGQGGFDPKLVVQGDFRKDGGAGPIPAGSPVYFLADSDPSPLWVYYQGLWVKSVPFQPGKVTGIWLAR